MPRSQSTGSTPSTCATARVEEHLTCNCGCAVQAANCSAGLQRFIQAECRCVCANDAERATCLSRGWYWNPSICQCMCANPDTFPVCPSGYHYDGLSSCTCVGVSDNAETVLAIIVMVLIGMGLLTACSLVQCYRTRTGLFVAQRRRDNEARASSTKAHELRTLFRAISHTGTVTGSGSADGGLQSSGENSWLGAGGYRQMRGAASAAVAATARRARKMSGSASIADDDERQKLEPVTEEENAAEAIEEEEDNETPTPSVASSKKSYRGS